MKKWELKEDLACWRQRAEVAERRVVELDGRLGATQRLVAQQATEESYAALAEEWKAAYAKDPNPAVTRKLMGYRVGPVTAYRVPDPADTAKVVGWTVCPRCRVSPPLPPRRICDHCETEVGARPVPYVGMTISGEDARKHLPDGAVLVHVSRLDGKSPWPEPLRRTVGPPLEEGGSDRGVVGHATYRIESLPDADRDAATVAAAERHGDEIGQRDRTAAIEGAAITLRAHARLFTIIGPQYCSCGWRTPAPDVDHARHVAEQLAAVGALGDAEPVAAQPVLIDRDGDEWWPTIGGRYVLFREWESDIGTRSWIANEYGPLRERVES